MQFSTAAIALRVEKCSEFSQTERSCCDLEGKLEV